MIRPMKKYVLVLPKKEVEQKIGKLVLASDGEKEPDRFGTVVEIGDGVTLVKPKDYIFFEKYAGHEITEDGERLLLIEEDKILGIINNGGE